MARPSRHVLPQDLNTAIQQLDDQELDRLVVVALQNEVAGKSRLCPKKVNATNEPKPKPLHCLSAS
jgi:hypothetical protein